MCSDHGEAFGEGGEYEHGDILEPQVRIPFLVHLPGMTEYRRERAPISNVDVAPTILGLAGVEIPQHYTGINVLDPSALSGERQTLVEDRDQMRAADVRLAFYEGRWKLVRSGLGEKQRFVLFDLQSDLVGLKDVAGDHPELVERLQQDLASFRARWNADDVKDQQGVGVPTADALKALGYTGH
jgi:arylsulfatase A-like enzyme